MSQLVVYTHGGLGNQIFQVFYARLFAEANGLKRLCRVHGAGYAHRFPASSAFTDLAETPRLIYLLSTCRIPKILRHLGIRRSEWTALPAVTILDGYFQSVEDYRIFSVAQIDNGIKRLRKEFGITGRRAVDLVHIRLGDFFSDEQAQREHLIERLSSLPPGADVMTNRDDLLKDPMLAGLLAKGRNRFVKTEGLAAEDILRMMASYQNIYANDSTLALWASVLGNTGVNLIDPRLRSLRDLLRQEI